ncbi:hypothetical protein DEU37_2882 [Microbacterium sp. AG790]|nr:hypothetical protein DEU37_2882 [Microbacterium sp. AG790]
MHTPMDESAWYACEAATIAVHGRDLATGTVTAILLLDTCGEVAQEIDRDLAKALALRLLDLADDLPEPVRIVRRAADVDEHLRELDD